VIGGGLRHRQDIRGMEQNKNGQWKLSIHWPERTLFEL
jgi:hypothetical protein